MALLNFAMPAAQFASRLRRQRNRGMMTSQRAILRRRSAANALRAAMHVGAACACALIIAGSAAAQDAQRPPQAPAAAPSQEASPGLSAPAAGAPAAPAPDAKSKPGFIDAFGRWLDEGATKFKSGMQDAQEGFDKLRNRAHEAARDATGTVTSLPNTRAVSGHERCATAPNGAPDCQAAALAVCRGKGFQSGKSLDTQSEQKCPARVLLEGRSPNSSECPTEIFVTRAMCQ